MASRVLTSAFLGIQLAMLVAQIVTLASTYWTSWDLRFNWTQTVGEVRRRPHSDGQLVSQGHAGLWSRCVKVYGIGQGSNDTLLSSDKCLSNFEDMEEAERYSYGKTCKTATAGLCVGEAAVTTFLLIVVMTTTCCIRAPKVLKMTRVPLLLLQGAISIIIPVIYISGNMAELVKQLTSAYGLLLVVDMTVWYMHDWAYWLQACIPYLWIISLSLFIFHESSSGQKMAARARKNGRPSEQGDAPELKMLRSAK